MADGTTMKCEAKGLSSATTMFTLEGSSKICTKGSATYDGRMASHMKGTSHEVWLMGTDHWYCLMGRYRLAALWKADERDPSRSRLPGLWSIGCSRMISEYCK